MFTPPPILDAEGPESNDYVLGNENVILNKEGKPLYLLCYIRSNSSEMKSTITVWSPTLTAVQN